ncbi:MAG: hypothetical protein U0529_16230 [Thermoanaerobaculia bacterium]
MSSLALDTMPLVAGFRLGEWEVEPRSDRVVHAGAEVRLRPRVVDLLVFLASRSGQVVTK